MHLVREGRILDLSNLSGQSVLWSAVFQAALQMKRSFCSRKSRGLASRGIAIQSYRGLKYTEPNCRIESGEPCSLSLIPHEPTDGKRNAGVIKSRFEKPATRKAVIV